VLPSSAGAASAYSTRCLRVSVMRSRSAWRVIALASFVLWTGTCGPHSTSNGGDTHWESSRSGQPADAVEARPPLPLSAFVPGIVSGRLVFHSDREGRNRLFVIDASTAVVRRLTHGTGHHDQNAAWSADCRQIAYETTAFDHRTFDVAIIDVDAPGMPHRLTTHVAPELQPAWAPDGGSVFFSSEQDGTQALFRAPLLTGAIVRVSPPPDRALMPSVSPDGRRVAYIGGSRDGLRVTVQDLETGVVQAVSAAGADAAEPRWSPDGTRIAYARPFHRSPTISVLTLASGTLQDITVAALAELREPTWSPDGRWLAAAGLGISRPADWSLVLLSADSTHAYQLTNGVGDDRAPSWSPC
jgi:TolB protein